MTYTTLENSIDNGKPYYLYEFKRGETFWRYAATENEIVVPSVGTFTPSSVMHGSVNQTGDIERISLDIVIPLSDPLAIAQRSPNISKVTTVTIYRGHYGLAAGTEQVVWKGRVVSYSIEGVSFALICENIQTTLRRAGLRAKFQRTCRHVLYSTGCTLNLNDFLTATTVTSVSGTTVVVAPLAGKTDVAEYYTGGILSFNGELNFISRHSGTTLTMLNPVTGLVNGSAVSIAAGCNLARSTCETKFNNLNNFGGFPYLPDRNPFNGFNGQPLT